MWIIPLQIVLARILTMLLARYWLKSQGHEKHRLSPGGHRRPVADEPSRRKAKRLPVLGESSYYPTKEAAKTSARLWAESMIEQGLAP